MTLLMGEKLKNNFVRLPYKHKTKISTYFKKSYLCKLFNLQLINGLGYD